MNGLQRVVVVGGGVSGLAAAWRLHLLAPHLELTVLEAANRCGGKLISEQRDGFVVEAAADGFLARKPPALAWAQELGLGPELIEPRPEHRFSHVLWKGQLHRLPEGFSGLVPTDPEALLRSSLLTPEGARRAALEPNVPPFLGGEESVHQFFVRRYGAEAFERLMEPLLSGIFAGDASELSAEAAFPQLVALERAAGCLSGPSNRPTATGAAFRSFAGGMARLPAALEDELKRRGVKVVTGTPVVDITGRGPFEVHTRTSVVAADALVVALPPRAAGAVVKSLSSELAATLTQWPVTSVANLTLAFEPGEGEAWPTGSGFVAPRAGGTPYSAATWSSRKWPGRAPEGASLVRFYFGGGRDPGGWKADEATLVDAALSQLASFAGGRRPRPLWHRVFRWADGFAQPNRGHAARHEALKAARVPGLALAGGYFGGPGLPDCLARADAAAHELLTPFDTTSI